MRTHTHTSTGYGRQAGGTAYVGGWAAGLQAQPAFIFPKALGPNYSKCVLACWLGACLAVRGTCTCAPGLQDRVRTPA
jgi:hypothetical protein